MSVVFKIKNKKKFLGYASVLSVGQALEILPGLEQFNVDESERGFDRQKFYSLKIPKEGCLLLGVRGVCGRGFELGYNDKEKSYEIRVLTPSARSDWQTALKYISNLAAKLGANITADTSEEIYDAASVLKFDYERDIMFGLKCDKSDLQGGDEDMMHEGLVRPFAMNFKMIEDILSSQNPIDKFSQMMVQSQRD